MPLVFPGLLVGFGVIFTVLVLFGMHGSTNTWARALLESLAHPKGSFIKRLALKAVGFVLSGVLFIERQIRHAISRAAQGSMHALAHWLNGLESVAHHVVSEIEALSLDVEHALERLVTHKIPSLIHRVVNPVDRLAHAALKEATRSISLIHRAERDFTRGIDRLAHRLEAELARRIHGIDRLLRDTVLPRLRTAERAVTVTLPREILGVERRLSRIEKALGLGIIGALVYRILARVAPWIFCRNVKKVGNTLCGLNTNELNGLIAALLGVLALTDLRALARLMEATEEEAAREVRRLLSAF